MVYINNKYRLKERKRKTVKENTLHHDICRRINGVGFSKILRVHEIIFHYTIVIIHSNNNKISTSTPPNTFVDYTLNTEFLENMKVDSHFDSGDKGKSLLFGNKIKYIYPNGTLFILYNKNYDMDIDTFVNKYLEKNYFKDGDKLNIEEEVENNKLIKLLVEEKEIKEVIILSKSNITGFRIINTLAIEEESDDEEDEDYQQGISRFKRVPHIFK